MLLSALPNSAKFAEYVRKKLFTLPGRLLYQPGVLPALNWLAKVARLSGLEPSSEIREEGTAVSRTERMGEGGSWEVMPPTRREMVESLAGSVGRVVRPTAEALDEGVSWLAICVCMEDRALRRD